MRQGFKPSPIGVSGRAQGRRATFLRLTPRQRHQLRLKIVIAQAGGPRGPAAGSHVCIGYVVPPQRQSPTTTIEYYCP
eukprot:6287530-Pyramimonas_sp.AAC.1